MFVKLSDRFSKYVLAIDTSLSGCVIGLLNPINNDFFEDVLKTDRAQSAMIVPMIKKLIHAAGASFDDVGLIVTTHGPGSFTGLRIGMTTAITLGMSLNIPVQSVGTIETMIKSCAKDTKISNGYACVLETKRADFYFGAQDKNFKTMGEFFSGKHEDILNFCEGKNLTLCGDATARFLAGGGQGCFDGVVTRDLLDAKTICHAGLDEFIQNGQKAIRPKPLYLRGADVSKSSKLQREINNLPL